MTRLVLPTLFLGVFTACGGGSDDSGCPYNVDTLPGTTWAMWEFQPDKTAKANPMARMQFFTEDGQTKVKYTAKSLGDVYTYECINQSSKGKSELFCTEKPRIAGFCKALLAYESDACTVDKLKELGVVATDEEFAAGIKEAKEEWAKFKDDARWSLMNNNLGNKLQGMLYVKVNDKRCNLSIDDMYRTVHNGRKVEDFNPVGKNPFVAITDKTYLFEHCEDGRSLVDLDAEERPDAKAIPPQRMHTAGEAIWYHDFSQEPIAPEEGCTYSFDTYKQWEPVEKGVSAPVEDKRIVWKSKASFAADALVPVAQGKRGGVFHQVRYKECGGTKEQISVACNVGLIQ